ncbi:MAG: hypothetical protein NTW83_02045 [Cyanobacteria bacterium]|nr:hypothetical protein [Cyanobacteriota bacterium]
MASQVDGETLTLPTGSPVFHPGDLARAIYGVRKGIVELIDASRNRLCYRHGELFSYEDIAWRGGYFRNEAIAGAALQRLLLLLSLAAY